MNLCFVALSRSWYLVLILCLTSHTWNMSKMVKAREGFAHAVQVSRRCHPVSRMLSHAYLPQREGNLTLFIHPYHVSQTIAPHMFATRSTMGFDVAIDRSNLFPDSLAPSRSAGWQGSMLTKVLTSCEGCRQGPSPVEEFLEERRIRLEVRGSCSVGNVHLVGTSAGRVDDCLGY